MKPLAFALLFFFTHESDVSQLMKKILCLKQKKIKYEITKKDNNVEMGGSSVHCIREPLMYSNQAIALARACKRYEMIMKHVHPEKIDGE